MNNDDDKQYDSPSGEVRRWLLELKYADDREEKWRKAGKAAFDKYKSKNAKQNSFNILWSNTETMLPAVYNSTPKPDVRRRFKDADPVGKAVSEVLSRALEFTIDDDRFYRAIKNDVLDMLLCGRGCSRIKYEPELADDQITWEHVLVEHVQWDDLRIGPGDTWDEVDWVAFRHDMTRSDMVELFGEEVGKQIPVGNVEKDGDVSEVFGTAEIWEFCCKSERQIIFISDAYKEKPLKKVADPLGLQGFFTIPRPLYAVQDSTETVPIVLYDQYKEQAKELDDVSKRINSIVKALKVRGIYDSTLTELGSLLDSSDNELVPTQNAAMWAERGGIEKAIWMMPIKDAASVLQVLYQQRDAIKQVIYEVTGIADVMRGASDPNETLGAQKLKAEWGGQRVREMQREVQRYIRDIIRLIAEVIAERFQPETLLEMTSIQLPKMEQAAMIQPPPKVVLEQVMQVLRDDKLRSYRVDVETDSTISATQQDDIEGLTNTLSGIVQFVQGIGPAIKEGAFPVEAAKEIVLTISRRAKMGNAVEDALEKIQQPQQQDDGRLEAVKQQADAQIQSMQQQTQAEKAKLDIEKQALQVSADQKLLEISKQEFELQKAAFDVHKREALHQVNESRAGADVERREMSIKNDEMTRLHAEMSAELDRKIQEYEQREQAGEIEQQEKDQKLEQILQMQQELVGWFDRIAKLISAPRRRDLIKNPDGSKHVIDTIQEQE